MSVVRHRDDDERSAHYDDLMTADDVATKELKGLHAANPPTARRFNDLTLLPPKQVQSRLNIMTRMGRIRCVVEYVINGSRFKLFIPKEGTFLMFALNAVSCPMTGRNGAPDEEYSVEAVQFARKLLMQVTPRQPPIRARALAPPRSRSPVRPVRPITARSTWRFPAATVSSQRPGLRAQRDVYIEIESVNKGGCFMGSLYYDRKKPYAATLLQVTIQRPCARCAESAAATVSSQRRCDARAQEGLGYIGYRASEELLALEKVAKDAKLKIWENYTEEAADSDDPKLAENEFLDAEVSHVTEGGSFHVHMRGDAGLEFITTKLGELGLEATDQVETCPSKGSKVCALWDDDKWYRGKVVGRTKDADTGTFNACQVQLPPLPFLPLTARPCCLRPPPSSSGLRFRPPRSSLRWR